MTIIAVPLSKLQVSPLNVRINQEDAESTDALEASILAHGLLEPMIGHPVADRPGDYAIFAGGRRLRALRNLADRGELPAGFTAEIIVRDLSDEQITEASTAENYLRRDLREYELYRAFATAQRQGISREDLARHFGQRQIVVDQILRLGNLHPLIFDELAAGRLTDECARAFAATEDQELQLAIFSGLRQKRLGLHPVEIRQALKVRDRDDEPRLLFVGRDAYEAAGGYFELDLFDETGSSGRVANPEILLRLYEEKLAATRERYLASANREFRFVDARPTTGGQYGYVDYQLQIEARLSPLSPEDKARREALVATKTALEDQARALLLDDAGERLPGLEAEEADLDARYDAIEAELAAIDATRRYQLPRKGDIVAVLEVDRAGVAGITFWYPSKAAKKEATAGKKDPAIAEGGAANGDCGATRAANARARDELGVNANGIEVARSLRRSLLRAILIEDAQRGGDVARDYLVWSQLRAAVFDFGRTVDTGAFTISAGMYDSTADPVANLPFLKDCRASEVWDEAVAFLKEQSFITSKNLGGAFIDFQAADPHVKMLAAAVVAGISLKRSVNADGYRIEVHDVVANATCRSYPEALRELWTPTTAFVDLLPKAKRLEQIADMVDAKTFAAWGKRKAAEISDLVVKVMTGRSPSLKAGAVSKAKAWVHPLLTFGRPDVLEASVAEREAA
jgi:ParB family chromosome partitioning protein